MFDSILEVLQIQHMDFSFSFFFFKACMTVKGLNNTAVVYQWQSGAREGVSFFSFLSIF